jgi:hypothetical protein
VSEVLKWMALGEMTQRSRIGGGTYVLLADFDAEHALRLEADKRGDIAQRHLDRMIEHSDSLERQVGELREQLATMTADRDAEKKMKARAREQRDHQTEKADDAQACIDTAMGLLRGVAMRPSGCTAEVPVGWWNKRAELLLICMPSRNTTSTEGES